MTVKDAIIRLTPHLKADDDEAFHIEFDEILEEHLMELDPKFMKALNEYYEASEMSRWYA